MPRLWGETVVAHRRAVRDAILDTVAIQVAERGLLGVTMSKIAEEAGIGRATLYKYFADTQAVLAAWHERVVAVHLQRLVEVRDRAGGAYEQLEAVLSAYAVMIYERPHDSELAAVIHRGEHVARAHHTLEGLVEDMVTRAAVAGAVRDDVAPRELASYCVAALAAASGLSSKAAVRRLVGVTLAGLRPLTPRRSAPRKADVERP